MKNDFPLLNNSDIVYLDSAATSQKPKIVIDSLVEFYENYNANAHRGSYKLSLKASQLLDESRSKVASFINADINNIVFTKNATEASNMIATYFNDKLKEDDEIVISILEHHANLVPYFNIINNTKSKLVYLYLDNYDISNEEILNKINNKTKLVCINHISNVFGTVNNIDLIIKKAHEVGALVVLDVSQSVAHTKIDVKKLDVDFMFFSGHKMLAPLGVGVMYGKENLLNEMNPFLYGGDMIEYVYEDHATYTSVPTKFEAGTQDVASIYGLSKAIDYINNIGFDKIEKINNDLFDYAYNKLKKLDFIEMYIPNKHSSIISFNVKNVHAHDVASILEESNICIRVGNHCCQPLLRNKNLDSTCRISFYIYNTFDDIDILVKGLYSVEKIFKKVIYGS